MKFLIYYSHGDAWITGKPTNQQPHIFQHAIYIQNLFNEGKIILAGPFDDHSGGTSIIEVSNEEEANDVMNNDPIV
ncbi:YciI family protein, partial [Paenibacillus sp. TAF58]